MIDLKKKVLVIGHKGLIGSCLVNDLENLGYSVDILNLRLNQNNLSLLRSKYSNLTYEAIFNCAWPLVNEYASLKANIEAIKFLYYLRDFLNFLGSFDRLYLIGSCLEYGFSQDLQRIINDDTQLIEPYDFYSFAKLISRDIFSDINEKLFYGIPFYVYSEKSNKGLFEYIKSSFLSNKSIVDINSPENKIDWIHAKDVSRGLAIHLYKNSEARKFNISSGERFSLKEVLLAATKDKKIKFNFEQKNPISSFLGDSVLLNNLG